MIKKTNKPAARMNDSLFLTVTVETRFKKRTPSFSGSFKLMPCPLLVVQEEYISALQTDEHLSLQGELMVTYVQKKAKMFASL